MKKNGLGLSIFLIVLVVVGWGVYFGQGISASANCNEQLRQAEAYCEKSLYQKAIACYDNVLLQKDNQKIRNLWLEAHKNAYLDQAMSLKEYTDALDQMCDLYPEDAIYWEELIKVQMDNGNLSKAYESYIKCTKKGNVSDTVAQYAKTILYTYNVKSRAYPTYVRNTSGYYMVFDGEEWGVLSPSGETVFDIIYEYISPFNSTYQALYVSGKGQRIETSKGVVEKKIDIEFTKTGAYENGLLPVCAENGTWQYLDCDTNSFVEGVYEQASNYANGVAAVCKNGSWILINTAGEQVSKTSFSDIKLHSNGDYLYDGVMIAAQNGEYGMYSASGESLNGFKAKDMDIYLGGYIAFANDTGNWGFATKDGAVAIEAQYVGAKSFSNKLATVSNGQQWGFINTSEDMVIQPAFLDAGYFTAKGACMVSVQEGKYNVLKLKFVEE